jgi:hypothetical protein
MKSEELRKKLIAIARANPPGEQVPLAFEKRIMALIKAAPVQDLWAAWAKSLWYAAAPCVAIMLAFSAWAFVHSRQNPSVDLAQQLNSTLLAAVDQNNNDTSW